MQNTGERQVAPTLDGIRKDHIARYKWAAKRLSGTVYDLGCGVGYGSRILADAGCEVLAIDKSTEAITYGLKHYASPRITFLPCDLSSVVGTLDETDAAVCFEVIEHVEDPRPILKGLTSKLLLASVPNEEVFPWQGYAYHHRHYTKQEFTDLLDECGWTVTEWHGQLGPESPVKPDVNGRTLIAVCVPKSVKKSAPESVAIIGLGPSKHEYASAVAGAGDRRKLFDETWCINAAATAFDHDLMVHMDDVRIQMIRAEAAPQSNIAAMVGMMKQHGKPILTSRPHADFPTTIPMPIEAMVNELTYDYFNNTAAWAVAYAIHLGVKRIGLFGCDYTYKNRHDAEKGRACLEFWLGYAAAKGIKIILAQSTTLMDACEPRRERLYGYDTVNVSFTKQDNGSINVEMEELDTLPTAEEIEWRYNHNRHPNPIAEALEDE